MTNTFYLPDFWDKFNLNIKLIELKEQFPQYFYEFEIGAIYGCFPRQIWNGGRIKFTDNSEIFNWKDTIDSFNNLGIPIRFTYTNCLLEEHHLKDYFCNFVTEYANNGKNEILVNSPLLEQYLRENYKNYKYCLSTTTNISDINTINQKIDDYYCIVPAWRCGKDINFLKQIKNPNKIELLCNEPCDLNCKYRQEHYKKISWYQLRNFNDEEFYEKTDKKECPHELKNFFETLKLPTTITKEELYTEKIYEKINIHKFKIQGRNINKIDLIYTYAYYLVKPKYKDIFIYEMTKNLII